jgi:signal recognition particle receptor subunit beta
MWDILSKGMLGYVLLVDAGRRDTWHEAAGIKERFDQLGSVPMVVAANHCDLAPADLAPALGLTADVPVVPCQAVDKESVKNVLLTLLIGVVEQLESTVKGGI